MKRKYLDPETEIIYLDSMDVIVTSDTNVPFDPNNFNT